VRCGLKKLGIYNEAGRTIYVAIEPIGDAYSIGPKGVVELVGSFDLQGEDRLDISVFSDTISVYCPEDTKVFMDGEELRPTED
jgi:hypothetical protein